MLWLLAQILFAWLQSFSRRSLLFASLLRSLPPLGLGSFVLRLFESLLCGDFAIRAFFRCGVFLAGSWVCSKWASNVAFFRWRRKRAYLLKESTWGYVELQRRRCRFGS